MLVNGKEAVISIDRLKPAFVIHENLTSTTPITSSKKLPTRSINPEPAEVALLLPTTKTTRFGEEL